MGTTKPDCLSAGGPSHGRLLVLIGGFYHYAAPVTLFSEVTGGAYLPSLPPGATGMFAWASAFSLSLCRSAGLIPCEGRTSGFVMSIEGSLPS